MENEDMKYNKRSKFIRKILQNNSNDGSRSTRKSFSPPKYNKNVKIRGSKQNITNNNIMRRQLNALKDIVPPSHNRGLSFVYNENMPTPTKNYEHEQKIIQQIKKSKPKINPPSPNKKIRKHLNNQVYSGGSRGNSFNSTIKYAVQTNGIFFNYKI